jgi:signal transduction histidine kinase
MLIAAAYVAVYAAVGQIAWGEFVRSAFQFWVGDAIGILVTTPVLLHLLGRQRPLAGLRHGPEIAAQAAAVVGALWAVFGLGGGNAAQFFYLLFLPLIWVSVRHGVRGAAVALLAIQLGIVGAVQTRGYGSATLLEFQLLMTTLAVTGLFLGAVVTDRRRAQEELARSLRLAAAADTASSLAHELHQPLSAIGSYVRACSLMLDDPTANRVRLVETMGTVVAEVARAGEIVRRLRDFFRSGASQLERIDVAALVEASVRSLGPRVARHRIDLRLDIAPQLPELLVDRLQIETVLHNLIVNSIDAIVARGTGKRLIIVRAEAARNGVRLTVADSGPGLPADRADDPFRPFATRKPQGMGLGLAISRSIVENHGGHLVAERREQGAAFSFVLPVEVAEETVA